jgi:RNA polymerase sigma factor (sigma-70 family)
MIRKSLTAVEERQLFRRWKKGDEDAGNEIVEAFRPWTITIARNYCGGRSDVEIEAAALEGLADAMRQFDLNRKVNGKSVRFSSFARLVVNQTIQRQITHRARTSDHMAYCGHTLPETLTDKLWVEPDHGEQKECVDRLMFLILHSDDLNPRAKQVLRLFIKNPSATLKTVGDELGITREGVRQHLLKIRHAVLVDIELATAAVEAGLNLDRK